MLAPDKIDTLIQKLEAMAQDRPAVAPEKSALVRRFERWGLRIYLGATFLIVILGVLYRYSFPDGENTQTVGLILSVVLIIVSLLYLATFMAVGMQLFWRNKQRIADGALPLSSEDAIRDADHIKTLCSYPKPLLEYALLHSRHRWGITERRTTLLAGELRKLGLFPAFIAVSVSAQKLLESNSNTWLWMPTILTGSFILILFHIAISSERRAYVQELMEYAIKQAKNDENTSPPPADARYQEVGAIEPMIKPAG
ncbi:hypothetical protein KDH83_00945 [Achromobacter sp. Marseille-Q0513]|uniref:hypothetical protein n=1 Tax=Achromobacter sp. Marseille-Q0513 TaxID=2829161 RepID=UPI001B95FDC8|nr:hypothetical protein [Achromobacter sp. Marseille-Q0513]MBR8651872.1 hypothetical protein [Achromobacter sp. Marseille-Q0513]